MITENLQTLKIHKLTQEQYKREYDAGRIDKNALYLTPDNGDIYVQNEEPMNVEDGAIWIDLDDNVIDFGGNTTGDGITEEQIQNIIANFEKSMVPVTRTINGKKLSSDIVLTAEDIGVVIDPTLKIEGMAADAKAVGDALQVEQFSVELGVNGTMGGYKTGDVIAEGTSVVTIINKLLRKAVPATYTKPKVTLVTQNTDAGSYEYGTNIIAQVKATFTKNDAGAMQSIAILKDGVEILTGTSNTLTSDAETFELTSTVSYTASATYAEGSIKNNNLGEESPDGHIDAGTVTSSAVTFTPYRQGYFYGVLATDKSTPLTSEIIRSCNKKDGAYAAGNLPLISASSVDKRKRIFVACPATSKGVTKVVMPSAQGSDATKEFVKQSSTVIVEGANGATGIDYNVWVYEPALISDDQTFTVTLG